MHYRPTVFPVNSVKVMRICCLLEGNEKGRSCGNVRRLLGRRQGHLAGAGHYGDLQKVGLDPKAALEGIEQQPVKDKLRNNTQELIKRGGFGSPTMFVGGDDMYFGNDRLPLLKDAVLRRRR